MKKKLCIYILIFFAFIPNTFARMVPDNDAILKAVIDSNSPFYYPSLMLRYISGDTSLTLEDYHYLYYGYAFQDEYSPLEPVSDADRILMIFELDQEPGYSDSEMIIELARDVMLRDPFSPRNINFLTYAYGRIGDTINERINADRLSKILQVIEMSGTGLTESSPWHVIWFSHVNDVLGSKGIDILRRRVVSRSVEFVEPLERVDRKIKGYYFDFSRVYWKQPENTPKRERTGLKFKNLEKKYIPY